MSVVMAILGVSVCACVLFLVRMTFPGAVNKKLASLCMLSLAIFSSNQVHADPLQSGDFTFSITTSAPPAGSCTGPSDDNCSHVLNSITISGVTYSDFTVPSGFSVSGFPAGANVQSRIYNTPGDYQFGDANYAANMLANVFSDQDLNRYQQVDSGAGSGASTFVYPTPVPTTDNYYFVTTERNGNNDQIIQAFDQGGVSLGTVTVNRNSSDYTNTGVEVGFNQDSYIAVIPMSEFADAADPSRQVRSVQITYTGNDGADHKTFIIGEDPTIAAVNDDPATVDGLAGATTPESVLDNDTLNGALITDPADVTLTPGTAPTPTDGAITMNADGTITVAPGTTAGSYSYPYQICDALNPANCANATATVVVGAPTIAAVNDDPATVDGLAGATTPESVLDNDTLNGALITDPADVTLTPGTAPTPTDGAITMNADGTITVAPGTTAGSYSYPYQICDALNPANCANATATVVVGAPTIAAVNDDPATVDGLAGATTPESVLDNDTLNGALITDPADVTLTPGTAPTPTDGAITMNADGTITVAPGTTAGSYSYPYQICDALNPANCANATATVVVGAPTIAAVNDDPATVDGLAGATTPESVLDNDTLNGALITDPADVTLTPGTAPTPTDGAITMNADGTITVAPGTTAGSYSYPYQICDALNPANCANATATVVVGAPTIAAVNDDPATVDGLAGATTPESVLDNDTLNGALITDPADVTLTPGTAPTPTDGAITMNADGTITVAPGTTAGSYSYPYQICDALNPANCANATATVVVGAPTIVADDDDYNASDVSGSTGGSVGSVLDNDTLNTAAVSTSGDSTTITVLDDGGLTGVSIADDGTITVPAGIAAGTYAVTYRLCDELNPTNCDTAIARISISENDLIAAIEEDLLIILEEDLAATITQQSQQMNSYAAGALDRLRERSAPACQAAVNARLKDEKILFDTDRDVIKQRSYRVLDDIAQILGTCAGSRFEIAGHTDSDASEAYNLDLSQRRVEAVLRALTDRDVDTTGFVARGYGESRPIASNATAAGKAMNRRVEFIALDPFDDFVDCGDEAPAIRSFDASAGENGVLVDGYLFHENRDCARDAWQIVEGSLSYLETDSGHSQSMVNLSYRRERFKDADSVRGYFVGMYASQNDISSLATGEINGIGVNAGIYGADRLRNGLYLDYYLGAAVGRHKFDLAFDRSIGTIDASGNYQYVAGFAGAALSGELQIGERTVTPRVGFDYAYSPGGDVDVIAELDGVTQSGDLKLGSLSGGRVFAEIRDEYLINDGMSLFAITPRFACYQSLGSFDGVCSIGGSIEFSSVDDENDDVVYSVKIDGERGQDFSKVSLTGSVSKRLRTGAVHADVTMDDQGALGLGGRLELAF